MPADNIFEMDDATYLRNLAERLMYIPVMYGVDGGDIDRLTEVVKNLEAK